MLLTLSGVREGSAWDRLWRNARVPRFGDQNPPEVVAQITEQQDLSCRDQEPQQPGVLFYSHQLDVLVFHAAHICVGIDCPLLIGSRLWIGEETCWLLLVEAWGGAEHGCSWQLRIRHCSLAHRCYSDVRSRPGTSTESFLSQ